MASGADLVHTLVRVLMVIIYEVPEVYLHHNNNNIISPNQRFLV